jgi:dUTP pyrophosphatase
MSPRIKKIELKVERISPNAQLPKYAYWDDSGADICSTIDYVLKPQEIKAIPSGLRIEIPKGFELQVRPRSGYALKHGIILPNSPGTIDAGYRGEIKVIMMNLGQQPFHIKIGQRIAQVVLKPVSSAKFKEVPTISSSQRGLNGFGSTGCLF